MSITNRKEQTKMADNAEVKNMEENRRKRKMSEDSSSSSDSEINQKTSTEILNELFGAFEFSLDGAKRDKPPSKKSKKEKKRKKEKHKHKHKEKDKDRDREKHRKREYRKASSEARRLSLIDNTDIKIEVRKEKESRRESREEFKRFEEILQDFSKDTKEEILAERKVETKDKPLFNLDIYEGISVKIENLDSSTNKCPTISEESVPVQEDIGNGVKEPSPDLPSVVPKLEEEIDPTQVFDIEVLKPSTGVLVGPAKGKIQIKSLKSSAVFEQTIREIEEEARKRAEKYEEGELTPSSSSRPPSSSPSLSDVELPPSAPSPPLQPTLVSKIKEDKPQEKASAKSRPKSKDDNGSQHKDKSRSRSRSRDRRGKIGDSRRHRSKERSKEHPRERRHSRSRERERSSRDYRHTGRDRRRSHERRRDRDGRRVVGRSRSRERERDRDKRRNRDQERRERRDRRSNERERPEDEEKIDKRKLLAIARRNAMYLLKEQQERMIQAGIITGDSNAVAVNSDGKAGKTVAELTEYCKQLVKSGSGSSDDDTDISLSDGEGPTESFIHHPFTLKDRPNAIIMNIRNSTQLPTRSMQEKAAETSKMRSLQFPVSSGQQHRSSEWVPVSPKKPEPEPVVPVVAKPVVEKPPQESQVVDIGSIVSQKLSAMRKMQESAAAAALVGPDYGYGYGHYQQQSYQAGNLNWESGQFTGTTGARVLTPAELASGQQAWARKDQLKTAAPVAGGMGMKLLQKMGWRPGEGLGKNKEGSLEPLKLDVKFDKKGLVAPEETKVKNMPFAGTRKKGQPMAVPPPGIGIISAPTGGGGEVFSGKHPVSALVELCTKRHWNPPIFDVVFESGPDHKKNFVFKVTVNNKEYQPNIACGNKKQAKALSAQYCLEQLGLVVKMVG